ncbi:MAG: hypothetical protein VKL60_00400 [Sphaerospermopsis sp.]|nr:hypothetical protein [Sphaerospermopsis sp.]
MNNEKVSINVISELADLVATPKPPHEKIIYFTREIPRYSSIDYDKNKVFGVCNDLKDLNSHFGITLLICHECDLIEVKKIQPDCPIMTIKANPLGGDRTKKIEYFKKNLEYQIKLKTGKDCYYGIHVCDMGHEIIIKEEKMIIHHRSLPIGVRDYTIYEIHEIIDSIVEEIK